MSKHHRRPKSLGGKDNYDNISRVSTDQHAAWHRLFANMDPYQIARHINLLWLDPDFYFIVRHKAED